MKNKNLIKILFLISCMLFFSGCNKFSLRGWASSFGYNSDQCEARDRTQHAKAFASGRKPGRACINYREFMCRIEKVCINKSEIENESCRQDARNYWGMDERGQKICDSAPE